jgi:hypothetical protein
MRDGQKFNIQFVATVERYPVIHNHVKSGYSKKKVPEKFGMQM